MAKEISEKNQRKRVTDRLLQNPTWLTSSIAKAAQTSSRTTEWIIQRFIDSVSFERESKSGGKELSRNRNRKRKIIRALKQNSQLSLQHLGHKYGSTRRNIFKIKAKHGYKSSKMFKVPNWDTLKENCTILSARRMYMKTLTNFSDSSWWTIKRKWKWTSINF